MKKNIYALLMVAGLISVSPPPLQAAGSSTGQQIQDQAKSAVTVDRPSGPEARQVADDVLAKMKAAKGWARAELGEGFEIFKIPDAEFLVAGQLQDLAPLYQPLGMWAFPVKTGSDDGSEFLLKVRRKDNKWIIASETEPAQARNASSIARAWPKSKGYDYKLISASALDICLVEISQGGRIIGLVRSSSEQVTDFDPSALIDPREAAMEVQDIVKRFNESRKGR